MNYRTERNIWTCPLQKGKYDTERDLREKINGWESEREKGKTKKDGIILQKKERKTITSATFSDTSLNLHV